MVKLPLSRRRFLERASQAAFLGAAPALWPAPAAAAAAAAANADATTPGANERLSIGLIGAGDRGSQLLAEIRGLASSHQVEVVAVCDVWKVNLERGAAKVKEGFGKDPRKLTRFADLLELRDVDAVVIATPDFAHIPILLAALEAGKDAYAEKPLAMDIAGANAALDLVRAKNRVVQCGTQFRSHGGYAAAAKVIAEGILGKVSRISGAAHFNEQRWTRNFDDCKEADVDWEAFLLDRPRRPFDPRLLRRWQLRREFTNGFPGLWMSHYADAVHRITGARYPASAVAHGGTYVWKDGRDLPDTFHAVLEYPEGFLFDWAMSLGNSAGCHFTVHGACGTLELSRSYTEPSSLALSPDGGAGAGKVEARKLTPEPTPSHMGNWLDCIRSRARPNADIEYGHQHAAATILAATAFETGRRQRYDAEKRAIREG